VDTSGLDGVRRAFALQRVRFTVEAGGASSKQAWIALEQAYGSEVRLTRPENLTVLVREAKQQRLSDDTA
jgi:hypothetical protein